MRFELTLLAAGFLVAAVIPVFATADEPRLVGQYALSAPPYFPDVAEEQAGTTLNDVFFAAPSLENSHRHDLGDLSEAERELLTEPTRATRVGIVRPIREVLLVGEELRLQEGDSDVGGGRLEKRGRLLIWTTAVRSPGADALRVQVHAADSHAGDRVFVYTSTGEAHGPYDLSSAGHEGLWTNTVFSDEVFVELQLEVGNLPRDDFRFVVAAVAHLQHTTLSVSAKTTSGFECIQDASCFSDSNWPWLSVLSRAVAQLTFIDGGAAYVCSGGLVNDSDDSSVIPYLLTANHCFSTQAAANTLEAFWNYRTTSCFGAIPNKANLQRTLGATMLATGTASDFTFVRLSQFPSGAALFGWNANPSGVTAGTRIYRIGHPADLPLIYSEEVVNTSPLRTCTGAPTSSLVYSARSVGTSGPGGSGGPASNRDGQIVGQLLGICGDAKDDPCGPALNYIVDGWFGATFQYIRQWIASEPTNVPCSATSSRFCTQSKRFEVSISAKDPRSGKTDNGHVMASTDSFGYFAFQALTGNTTDPQVFIKVLDGRPINGKFWVFYASLTDVEFTLRIRDTQTGATKTYYQKPYTQDARNDTSAF